MMDVMIRDLTVKPIFFRNIVAFAQKNIAAVWQHRCLISLWLPNSLKELIVFYAYAIIYTIILQYLLISWQNYIKVEPDILPKWCGKFTPLWRQCCNNKNIDFRGQKRWMWKIYNFDILSVCKTTLYFAILFPFSFF